MCVYRLLRNENNLGYGATFVRGDAMQWVRKSGSKRGIKANKAIYVKYIYTGFISLPTSMLDSSPNSGAHCQITESSGSYTYNFATTHSADRYLNRPITAFEVF